jgi:superfamily II DNA/RNA helicase
VNLHRIRPLLHHPFRTAGHLEDLAAERDILVLALHGDLPAEEQDKALAPQQRRKIVLATNVAETSVTVEGSGPAEGDRSADDRFGHQAPPADVPVAR